MARRPTSVLYKWIRSTGHHTALLLRSGTQLCTTPQQAFQALRRYWLDISIAPDAQWTSCTDDLQALVDMEVVPSFPSISEIECLQHYLKRAPIRTSPGSDNWHTSCLRHFTPEITAVLVEFYHHAEQHGRWPGLYGKWRINTSLCEVTKHMDPSLFGGLPEREVVTAVNRIALRLELAQRQKFPLFGLSIDASKCFDRRFASRSLRLFAVPERLASLAVAMHMTAGLIQGCALSALVTNAVVATWSRTVSPYSIPSSFLDDRLAIASTQVDFDNLWESSKQWDDTNGWVCNFAKSSCFTTSSSFRVPELNGALVESLRACEGDLPQIASPETAILYFTPFGSSGRYPECDFWYLQQVAPPPSPGGIAIYPAVPPLDRRHASWHAASDSIRCIAQTRFQLHCICHGTDQIFAGQCGR
eukprot:499006-Amphidinium_carterae.3